MKKIFVCENTVEGIYSGIYDAWKTKMNREELGIVLKGNIEQELFCEYEESEAKYYKSIAIERMILKHLGVDAYKKFIMLFFHRMLEEEMLY